MAKLRLRLAQCDPPESVKASARKLAQVFGADSVVFEDGEGLKKSWDKWGTCADCGSGPSIGHELHTPTFRGKGRSEAFLVRRVCGIWRDCARPTCSGREQLKVAIIVYYFAALHRVPAPREIQLILLHSLVLKTTE